MDEQQQPQKVYYRRKDAAKYIQETYSFPCSEAWLASLASKGGGPLFQKAGRVPLYSREDLDKWAHARLSMPYRACGIPATKTDK